MRRHHWRWAEDEYRRAAELAERGKYVSIDARIRLSEVLHDRGADADAAKLLDEVVADMEKNHQENEDNENGRRSLETTRARMHFFYACSLTRPDERNDRIRRLIDAVTEDSSDADALIAIYRIENLDPPLVEQNRKMIREAAEQFRQQMQQQPDDPTPYNQFAWLVANTEGDYREALRCSEKSLELVRANPALTGSESSLLDTLGRCYYAVGDYENAVKAQSRAVELEPESGLMSGQLEIFREALKKSKKKQ
jgi:tetratricopeptide (TPR) repeat protein